MNIEAFKNGFLKRANDWHVPADKAMELWNHVVHEHMQAKGFKKFADLNSWLHQAKDAVGQAGDVVNKGVQSVDDIPRMSMIDALKQYMPQAHNVATDLSAYGGAAGGVLGAIGGGRLGYLGGGALDELNGPERKTNYRHSGAAFGSMVGAGLGGGYGASSMTGKGLDQFNHKALVQLANGLQNPDTKAEMLKSLRVGQ